MLRWSIVCLCLCLVLTARAQEGAETYAELVRGAIEAHEAGAYDHARALFARAHALEPNARTLRGMGVAAFQAGHFAQAVLDLEAALAHPIKPLDEELRVAVLELIDRARTKVGTYRFVLEPSTASIVVDAESEPRTSSAPIVLDVGAHVVRVQAEGFESAELTFDVAGAERETVRLTLVPVKSDTRVEAPSTEVVDRDADAVVEPAVTIAPSVPAERMVDEKTARRTRTLWALGAVGAAAAITAGTTWLIGNARIKDIADSCRARPSGECTQAEFDTEEERAKLSALLLTTNVGLGVVGAAALSASSLWLSERFVRSKRVSASVGPRSFAVRVRF